MDLEFNGTSLAYFTYVGFYRFSLEESVSALTCFAQVIPTIDRKVMSNKLLIIKNEVIQNIYCSGPNICKGNIASDKKPASTAT